MMISTEWIVQYNHTTSPETVQDFHRGTFEPKNIRPWPHLQATPL